jgi:hypothetical protein
VFEQQRAAIELGAAPFWAPINGDPFWLAEGPTPTTAEARLGEIVGLPGHYVKLKNETIAAPAPEGWPQWFARYERILADRDAMKKAHPEKFAFLEMSDLVSFSRILSNISRAS